MAKLESVLARVRAICMHLDGVAEEEAWVGTRWVVRKKTFAHVVPIVGGAPPAYAKAAATDGPLVVLTVRIAMAGMFVAPRFFEPIWGTTWATKVLGIKLEGRVAWAEIEAFVVESYRLLAPKTLRSARRE